MAYEQKYEHWKLSHFTHKNIHIWQHSNIHKTWSIGNVHKTNTVIPLKYHWLRMSYCGCNKFLVIFRSTSRRQATIKTHTRRWKCAFQMREEKKETNQIFINNIKYRCVCVNMNVLHRSVGNDIVGNKNNTIHERHLWGWNCSFLRAICAIRIYGDGRR